MTKQILELIAEFAEVVAEWEGGAVSGTAYANGRWKDKVREIARRAQELANPPAPPAVALCDNKLPYSDTVRCKRVAGHHGKCSA